MWYPVFDLQRNPETGRFLVRLFGVPLCEQEPLSDDHGVGFKLISLDGDKSKVFTSPQWDVEPPRLALLTIYPPAKVDRLWNAALKNIDNHFNSYRLGKL